MVDITDLAKKWIAYWYAPEGSMEQEQLSWVRDMEADLTYDEPSLAWSLILEILRCDQTNHILKVLSTGPLEDLLAEHGPQIIITIEQEAKVNPYVAKLLGGVWQNAMTDEVWTRVQAVWDREGWEL